MCTSNFIPCFVSGKYVAGGVFNNKKAAFYAVDGKHYFLHNMTGLRDQGAQPANKKSFLFACELWAGATFNNFDNASALYYLKDFNNVANFECCYLEGSTEYDSIMMLKQARNGGEAPQPTPATPQPSPAPAVPEAPQEPAPTQPQPATPQPSPAPAVNYDGLFNGLIAGVAAAVRAQLEPEIRAQITAQAAQVKPQVQQIEVKRVDGSTVKIDGITHEKFQIVLNCAASRLPIYLYGPAGSGKNVLCEQIAKALGLDFYYQGCITEEHQLDGFIDANGVYHKSEFYRAATKGGVFMLDEFDASIPEVAIKLNAAIANRYYTFPNGRVNLHPDFVVIVAGNTVGTGATEQYSARSVLDAATLNRFVNINVDYDPRIDMATAGNDEELVKFIQELRRVAELKHVTNFLASPRDIKKIRVTKEFTSLEEALNAAIFCRIEKDSIRMMVNAMGKDFADNKYFVALKKLA
jgi:MoxR-like ATPase